MDDLSGTGPLGQDELSDGMDSSIDPLTTDSKTAAANGSPDNFKSQQPTLVINMSVQRDGAFPGGGSPQGLTIGAIRSYAWNFDPLTELDVNGGTLPISANANQALFSIAGTTFGGDGRTTFGLPDLEGNLAVGAGQGPGLSNRVVGQEFGDDTETLATANVPASIGGDGQGVNNVQDSQGVIWAINIGGNNPSGGTGQQGFLAQVQAFAVANSGLLPTGWVAAEGQLLSVNGNSDLFSLLGTTYGGDGRTTFQLPDLRGRTPVGEGQGPGLQNVALGQEFGSEENSLTDMQITALQNGSTVTLDNAQPSVGLNALVALNGVFPQINRALDGDSIYLGEIIWFAGTFAPGGFAFADGQLLPIAQVVALFSLIGTSHGGDGTTTFALPDLRGRAPVDDGNGFSLGAQLGTEDITLTAANIEGIVEDRSLVVTTTDDVVDATDMETSLREAIAFANSNTDTSEITFAAGVGEAFENGGLIRLTQGELEITESIIVKGAGNVTITADADDDDITVDGDITDVAASFGGNAGTADDLLDDNSRIFNATQFLSADVTVQGLTLTGGRTTLAVSSGGAIQGASSVTVLESVLRGNSTSGDGSFGGAVSATLNATLTDSVVIGNSTSGNRSDGGGVFSVGSLRLTNSIVSGNNTSGDRADGGGLGSLANVTLTDSTISLNSTIGDSANGGGIFAIGDVRLTNSTISENSVSGDFSLGGGISSTVSVSLTNTTVSANSATSNGGGIHSEAVDLTSSTISGNVSGLSGGGIYSEAIENGITLTDSIVVGNSATIRDDDLSLSTISATMITYNGSNIVGNDLFYGSTDVGDTTAAQIFATTFDNNGVDAGVLADNGGPVQTIALNTALSNPALDNSFGANIPAADARGVTAFDFVGVGTDGTAGIRDLGAFELIPEAQSLIVTTTADVVDQFDGETSLREALAFANSNADASEITFAAGVGEAFENGGTITLGGSQLTISTNVTINGDVDGDGTGDVTVDANDQSRVIEATAGVSTITGLTLTNGRVSTSGSGAAREHGGAINVLAPATLTVRNSDVTNSDASYGGGIGNRGQLNLVETTIAGNSSTYNGGGVSNFLGGNVTAVNSTFSGNSSLGSGGLSGTAADATLINTTFYGNYGRLGGAIGTFSSNVTATNVTITGNFALNSAGAINVAAGTITLNNSLVLGNSSGDGSEIAGPGGLVNNFSIIGGAAQPIFRDTVLLNGVEAGALMDNGGAVQTVALRENALNPALDAGQAALPVDTFDLDGDMDTAEALSVDARGAPRDVDLPGVGGTPDLGAYEAQQLPALLVDTTLDVVDANDGVTSLREAIALANDPTAGFNGDGDADNDGSATDRIAFDSTVFGAGATITLNGTELVITGATLIDGDADGDGDGDVTISGNGLSRVINTSGITTLNGVDIFAGRAGEGAGILASAALTLTNSTVSSNNITGAQNLGGGIHGTDVTLINTTIHGNSTDGMYSGGGGIYASSSLSLLNSTITGNQANGYQNGGGGVIAFGSGLSTTNSIIMGNFGGAEIIGAVNYAGGNIVSGNVTNNGVMTGTTTAADIFAATFDNNGVDAGVLANNGGGIYTVLLRADVTNAALDAGDDMLAPMMDTLGNARVDQRNVDNNGMNTSDLGALELAEFNNEPEITSADTASIAENTTAVIDVQATDLQGDVEGAGLTYAISGGVDKNLFTIDATTGELSFINAPNFEAPLDAGTDNDYNVQVSVTDAGGLSDTQDITVTVTDVTQTGLVVTTTSDVVEENDGVLSLREAITFANSNPGADTITFAAGMGEAFENGGLIRLTQGELEITETVTINGAGNVTITGDANDDDVTETGTDITDISASGPALLDDNSRIFANDDFVNSVTLNGLTLTGGFNTVAGGRGGAVYSDGELTITDSTFAGNGGAGVYTIGGAIAGNRVVNLDNVTVRDSAVYGGFGGGVFSQTLNVSNSTITSNTAFSGGGLAANELTLVNSEVSGNLADSSAGVYGIPGGGGILVGYDALIVNSTIADNATIGDYGFGGGISNFGFAAANLTLINSTVSGNSTSGANAAGGGIATAGNATITNSTITGNSTAGASALGGGILHYGVAADTSTMPVTYFPTFLTITNSIVSGNVTGYAGLGGDEISIAAPGAPAPIYLGGNLIGSTLFDGSTAQPGAISLGDVFDQTAEILLDNDGDGEGETASGVFAGVLANNGGPVQTVALLASLTNPAINTGTGALPADTLDLDGDMDTTEALPVDARGFERDADVPGVGGTPDIGAFEAQITETPGPDFLFGTNSGEIIVATQGGSDNIDAGAGSDGILFGAEFDPNDIVNGGPGNDQIGLQGDYSGGLTFGATSTQNIEAVVLLSGSDTRFGAPGTEMFSYDLTLVDANIPAGEQLTFQANGLGAGEDFTLDASAEQDGSVFVFGGLGKETLTGGQQDDAFFFGTDRFGPDDVVDGQGGTFDSMGLQGDYSSGITLGDNQLMNVEILALLSNTDTRFGGAGSGTPYSYDITMADGNVAAGETLGIVANSLDTDETLTLDGSLETDGNYLIFSGNGNDSIIGSQNADTISGRGGADTLVGEGGDDTYLYTNLSDSTPSAEDYILDFTTGDRISLMALDADPGTAGNQAFAFIGEAAFSNTVGELRSANLGGNEWRIEADVDGDGMADFSIAVRSVDGGCIDERDIDFGVTFNQIDGSDPVNDSLTGTAARDMINGLAGNDTLDGAGGNDDLFGGADNDMLFGGADNDELDGGAGDDTLDGGPGIDLLTGGAGADSFLFDPLSGQSTISDYSPSEDTTTIDTTTAVSYAIFADRVVATHSGGTITYDDLAITSVAEFNAFLASVTENII
ncbi:MAG: tail fiber protein [Pseudomonadota bacterium]